MNETRRCVPWGVAFITVVMELLLISGNASASGGACPAGLPVTGNNCYFIAANGSDSNNGTSETTPWLHAPGMPNCASNCKSVTPAAGNGFIFRGGDTWHFGNRAATPYTGGTWTWQSWNGSSTNCDVSDTPGAVRTSCIYVGVDKNWYSDALWSRPIMNGDNPTSTTAISSCPYGSVGSSGNFLVTNNSPFVQWDNFEWTGMCQSTPSSASNGYLFNWYLYIADQSGGTYMAESIFSNMYFHGWTHLPFSCSDSGGEPTGQCFTAGAINLGTQSTYGPGNVCDGWDSDPQGQGCIILGGAYLIYDNYFGHYAQNVVLFCHDIHDNVSQYYYGTGDGVAHGNSWECNNMAPGTDSDGRAEPNIPFNTFYNNIFGHNDPSANGAIKVQIALGSTTAAEYDFNNILYDQAPGNNWDYGCTGCSNSPANSYLFNNTMDMPNNAAINCATNNYATGNHIIIEGGGTGFLTTWNGGTAGNCVITSDVVMTHATAISQGYMAANKGTSGSNNNTTCANDLTPCAQLSFSDSTEGAGVNEQGYCTALLGSTQSMIVNAGTACKYGTTDGCTYNASTHTMVCPAQSAVARPQTGSWDAGAYEFAGSSSVAPPTNLVATSH